MDAFEKHWDERARSLDEIALRTNLEQAFRAGMRAAGDVAYLYLIEEYTHELGADVQNAILAEADK